MIRSLISACTRPQWTNSLKSPIYQMTPSLSCFVSRSPNFSPARTLLKTHKGAAKRWKALASGGFKRGKAGRRHGNVGWSKGVLSGLNGGAYALPGGKGNHQRRLKRLLPYA